MPLCLALRLILIFPQQTYLPLDNQNIAEIESAYLISFEKTGESNAMFSSYEQDENKQCGNKVYYTYSVTSSSGKEFAPTYNRHNLGNGKGYC